jgi:hypothetical protein
MLSVNTVTISKQKTTHTRFQFTKSQAYAILKSKTSALIAFSQRLMSCTLREWKSGEKKGDGRILLGDNTGGRAVMLRQITLQCAEVWISTGLPCIGNTIHRMHIQFRLAIDISECNYCDNSGSL